MDMDATILYGLSSARNMLYNNNCQMYSVILRLIIYLESSSPSGISGSLLAPLSKQPDGRRSRDQVRQLTQ
jgi:hypothetical protein